MAKLIRSRNGRCLTSLPLFLVALAIFFFALSNRSGQVAAAPSVTLVTLHFNGNPPEDSGCTGNGAADVLMDTCSNLVQTATLSAGPAAKWVAEEQLDQSLDRSTVDPNWIWVLSSPTTLSGPMTINWWQACSAACVALGADFHVSVWADGTDVFDTHVFNTPTTPNVPELLSATITLPTITANTKFVVKIDPSFLDTPAPTAYYDSSLPCPGVTTGPCDSTIIMPVVPTINPTPTPTPTPTFAFTTPAELTGHPPSPAFFQGDGEPEIKIDIFGNIYATAIQGVPGGVDLWKSINGGTSFVYMGQPDGLQDHCSNLTPIQCAAVGGADDSTDVSNGGYLYVSSLWNTSVTMSASMDGGTGGTVPGQAWNVNPAAAAVAVGVPAVLGDDRQWIASYGPQTVYLSYRDVLSVLDFQKSTDAGKTFGPPVQLYGAMSTLLDDFQGNMVVDQYNGNIYTTFVPQESGGHSHAEIWLARSTDTGTTWSLVKAYQAPAGTSNAGVFTILALDRGGNLHLAFSNYAASNQANCHVFLMSTANPTAATPTWTTPVQVDNLPASNSSAQPWIVAGSPGVVDVTWLGSTAPRPSVVNSNWHVFFAQVTNALSGSPTIVQNQVETPVMHNHSICFNGGGCASNGTPHGEPENRDMLEYYTMTLDPNGMANIVYSDSVNNCPTGTCLTNAWFTKQTTGPSAFILAPAPVPSTFAANIALDNGPQASSGEPNMRADSHNCLFSASNDGIPTGTADFWKSTNAGATWSAPINPVVAIGSQSGDEEIVTVPQASGARPDQLYFADLGADTVNISKSTDLGATWFAPGPGGAAGEVSASTDRQWMAYDRNGANTTVYLWEHEFVSQILRMNALTNDMVWSPFANGMTDPELVAPPNTTLANTVPGPVFADPATHIVYGFLAASTPTTNAVGELKLPNLWEADGAGTFTAGVPPGPFTNHPVFKGVVDSPTNPAPPAGSATVGSNTANLFNAAAIDSTGKIYVTWATPNARNGLYDVWFASSRDHGATYYGPFKINPNGLQGNMPWIAAGSDGRADIVFYGTTGTEDPTSSANNQWNVFFAQSLNAADREPVFTVVQASDHIMHKGPICNLGILCSGGTRQLKDFFQVAIGPDGIANIAYTDTGNANGNAHVSFARQNGGPLALTSPTFPTCVPIPQLTGVVSRKTHGALTPPPVGPGDLVLIVGTPATATIEPRAGGGTSGTQTLVFTFANTLTAVSSVTATATTSGGPQTIPPANITKTLSGNVCTVNLTGVPNASHLSVTLHGVTDSQPATGDVTQNMDVLYGDVNQSGNVDAADVGQVQRQNNQTVTTVNYLKDVNISGNIDAADVGQVQRQNSRHLP